jgi:hypothetical protein
MCVCKIIHLQAASALAEDEFRDLIGAPEDIVGERRVISCGTVCGSMAASELQLMVSAYASAVPRRQSTSLETRGGAWPKRLTNE